MTSCTKSQYIKYIFKWVINMFLSLCESLSFGGKDVVIFEILKDVQETAGFSGAWHENH